MLYTFDKSKVSLHRKAYLMIVRVQLEAEAVGVIYFRLRPVDERLRVHPLVPAGVRFGTNM